MALELRPYQKQCIDDLWNWFGDAKGDPLVVLPTGAGKSLVIAEWCKLVFDTDPSARILVLAHVRELIAQNYAEMMGLWPDAPAGIYSAGLNRRDMGARLLFASIQSIHRKAFKLQQCDIVLVDEAHLIPRNSETMYGKFLADLKIINPNLKIIGLTATPFRLDSGRLDEGENCWFDGIAHETNVRDLIDDGYLAPPRSYRQKTEIDTSGVGTRLGDFIAAQLEVAALDPETVSAICDRIVEAGRDRKSWLIFGCTVKHCEILADELRARGFTGQGIFGDTDKAERDRAISDYKAGRIRFLVSQGVLTTGFNARAIDLIALCRPTKSLGLYIQMVGRGTRLSPETGKDDCLVLDFAGAIATHGPIDDPFMPKAKGQGKGEAPFKECPECGCANGTMTRVCVGCGFEFPPPERMVHAVPDAKPILSVEPEWLPVSEVTYKRHTKQGGTDSMKVTYQVGLEFCSEWQCFDHTGFARSKAESWWRRRDAGPIPKSVTEALEVAEFVLLKPSHIRVKKDGQYWRIVQYNFAQAQSVAA